jgi:hypothetical protein
MRKPWFPSSGIDLVIFLLCYSLCFLMFRFDLTRHHALGHPMSNRDAAIFGLLITVAAFLYWKWKHER